YKEESQKSEEKKSIKKSEKSVRFADEELPPGKFYSCDVKSAQPNLSIDSPSTSSGIGLYHSDNLLPSTPTKKLFDDKMSEDIEDFNLFVAEDISLSEETDNEYGSQESSYQDKKSSKDSPKDTN
ncbi:hypothetical protein CDAR_278041, partial [Caerostris darwini]